MEINLKQLGEQAIESTTGSRKMKLSENASSMVFQLFTKNVYSNPIGTVVREITSNCFDSHIEANVNSPVIIRKTVIDETINISFIDFGVGMSPDRVYDIYGTYFESTKRVDNTQIGGFGIGGKTPLAYKRSTGQGEGEYDNSFYVITRFDGTEYIYLIYEGEETPVISELHSQPTKERNGTEVRIPVLEKDLQTFQKEMVKQLYYFENIIFEGFEYEGEYSKEMVYPMSNDYQILKAKTFLFRGDDYNNYMHICLGRVAYPIDYSVLGLTSYDYNIPIALSLNVGDIGVTVSRESLDYSEETIKLLKKKLEEAKAEILTMITKQYKKIKTLEEYFKLKTDFGKLEFKNGTSLYVGDMIKQKDVDFSNFKYSFMKMPSDKQLFKFFFDVKTYGKKTKSRYGESTSYEGSYESLHLKNNLLHFEDEFNRKIVKQAYLKDRFTTYFIINRKKIDTNWMRADIADLFNVQVDNFVDANGKPTKFIQSLLDMQEEYMNIVRRETLNYDTFEVPEDFIIRRKRDAGITPEMRKLTIPVRFGTNGRDRIKLKVLLDYKMPIFYGTSDDEYQINEMKELFETLFHNRSAVSSCTYSGELRTNNSYNDDKDKKSIMFIQIAKGNVKYMKFCKNANHISTFKTKMLYRKEETIMRYFTIYPMVEKFNDLPKFYRRGFIDKINNDLGLKVNMVNDYIDNLPYILKSSSLYYEKNNLSRYFKLDDVKLSKEEQEIKNIVTELTAIAEKNIKNLSYFNIPYSVDDLDDQLITLLELAIEF